MVTLSRGRFGNFVQHALEFAIGGGKTAAKRGNPTLCPFILNRKDREPYQQKEDSRQNWQKDTGSSQDQEHPTQHDQ